MGLPTFPPLLLVWDSLLLPLGGGLPIFLLGWDSLPLFGRLPFFLLGWGSLPLIEGLPVTVWDSLPLGGAANSISSQIYKGLTTPLEGAANTDTPHVSQGLTTPWEGLPTPTLCLFPSFPSGPALLALRLVSPSQEKSCERFRAATLEPSAR